MGRINPIKPVFHEVQMKRKIEIIREDCWGCMFLENKIVVGMVQWRCSKIPKYSQRYGEYDDASLVISELSDWFNNSCTLDPIKE